MELHGPLLDWYDANRRDLPWRRTSDPYAIWVSEVMLQQTQVATVIPYYERWMARFPTLEALARSSEQEVLSVWQGLGYYRRARMLLAGARQLAQGADWKSVPGIGPYTWGAIASIAFGQCVPLVDGNVERVYVRLNADDSSGASLRKNAWQWAAGSVHATRPGDWNQALMELGATICRPRNPDCIKCPVSGGCAAYRSGLAESLPTPAKRPAVRQLTHHTWVPICEGKLGLRAIPEGQWWAGMWEFPRSEDVAELERLLTPSSLKSIGSIRHTVTRHRITMHVSVAKMLEPIAELSWFLPESLEGMALPSPQKRAYRLASPRLDLPVAAR